MRRAESAEEARSRRRKGPDLRALRLAPEARRWQVAAVACFAASAASGVGVLAAAAVATVSLLQAESRHLADSAALAESIAVLATLVVARSALTYASRIVAERAATSTKRAIQQRVLVAATRGGIALDASPVSDCLPSLMTSGLDVLDEWCSQYLPALVSAVLVPPAVLIAVASLDARSALTLVATLPLLPAFGALIGIATARRARVAWDAGTALSSSFLDAVRGLVTSKLYRQEAAELERLRASTERHQAASMSVLRVAFLSTAALQMVATMSIGLLAVSCGVRVVEGRMDLLTALLVLVLAPEAYRPIQDAAARYHDTAAASAALDDVQAVLAYDIEPPPGSRPPDERPGIRLVDVTVFLGEHQEQPVLSALSLTVAPGEVVAVVGPSGVGKTTLLRVAAGLSPATGGGATRHRRMAHMSASPVFPLARSVTEAVRQGAPDAGRGVITRALELAGAGDFTGDDGLERPLTEGAPELSRGERQRIALARAFAAVLDGAPVMILDEPTAHLDQDNEREVLASVSWLAEHAQVAVLYSAHREAAAQSADRVVVLGRPASSVPEPIADSRLTTHPPGRVARAERMVRPARPERDAASATGRRALAIVAGAASIASSVALTATATWLLVTAADQPPLLSLSVAIVGVRLFALLRPVLRYYERLLGHDAALSQLSRRRTDVLARLIPLVPGRNLPARGEVLERLVYDIDEQVEGSIRGRDALASAALAGLGALAILVVLAPGFASLVAAASLGGVLLGVTTTRGGSMVVAEARSRVRSAWSRDVIEVLDGLEDLRASQGDEGALEALDRPSQQVRRADRRWARTVGRGDALGALAAGSLPLAALVALREPLAAGRLTPAVAGASILGLLVLGDIAAGVPAAIRAVAIARSAKLRTAGVLDSVPAAVDPSTAAADPANADVCASSVGASWDVTEPVLRHVDLALPAGSRVAVRGASGSGKSTLGAVLLGLLDRHAGRLTLAGVDISDLTGQQVREVVGAVGLADHVFAMPLRDNVALARPDASDDDIVDALTSAGLGPWLDRLPSGLSTPLSANGANVSTGEARRISIARAALARRRLLVLDEPVEGLDPATAVAVMDDLAASDAETSWLMLAHRDEGLRHTSQQLVLEGGRLLRPGDEGRRHVD